MAATVTLKPTVYVGTIVHTPTPTVLAIHHDSAVGVDTAGKITFVSTSNTTAPTRSSLAALSGWSSDSFSIVRTPHQPGRTTSFFFPGLIDTHTHAPQYPNTGLFGASTLLDWLNTYTFPLESSFRSIERARSVYARVVRRTLSHGTTAAAYYATVHVGATNLLADLCLQAGQRALVGRVCMDRLSPDSYRDESPASAVADTKACIAHVERIDPAGDLVRPVITPRFAPSCSDDCLRQLGVLHNQTGHWAQTHISENQKEIELVKQLFPHARDYTSVYDEAGLLTDKMILAHAVHLSADEVALISQKRTKIAHCPTSNTCLTSGAAQVRTMVDAGVSVGLGTDMSGGYSPSVLEMARQAMLVSRHVAMNQGDNAKLSVAEALYLATKGGAEVMGLEKKVGMFEVGLEWDAQLVYMEEVSDDEVAGPNVDFERGPVDVFGWESWEDRIAKWLYVGDDRNTAAVWVKGRLVHETPKYQPTEE